MLNLTAVPSVNLYCRVHVTCTFKIGQGVVKLLMGSRVANIHFYSPNKLYMKTPNVSIVRATIKIDVLTILSGYNYNYN